MTTSPWLFGIDFAPDGVGYCLTKHHCWGYRCIAGFGLLLGFALALLGLVVVHQQKHLRLFLLRASLIYPTKIVGDAKKGHAHHKRGLADTKKVNEF